MRIEHGVQRGQSAGSQLGILVHQQAIATLRALQQQPIARRFALTLGERDDGRAQWMRLSRLRGAILRGVVDDQHLGAPRARRELLLEGIEAAQKQVARLRVDDEDREVGHGRGAAARRQRRYSPTVLIQLVDPAAYTPPYDHALATALCSAGARVELITTSSPEWDAAMQRAQPAWAAAATTAGQSTYERLLDFYRRSAALPGRLRR